MNPPFFLFVMIPIKMKLQNLFIVTEVSRQNDLLPIYGATDRTPPISTLMKRK